MSDRIDGFPDRIEGVVLPRIWVAVALSILLHIAAMLGPQLKLSPPRGSPDGIDIRVPLTLRLMPPSLPEPPVIAVPRPAVPAPRVQRPKPAPRPQPAPPVIALNKPKAAAPAAPAVLAAPPAAPPVTGDLASYIEARRRARGAPEPVVPGSDDSARTKQIVAGNLEAANNRVFGYDPNQGGGVFQISSLGYDYAEFIFYGWNRDISRNTKQLIEVRKGDNSDIRIAVVRRMVSIIREYEQEDFLWVSQRLRRSVTLSARPRDRAGLEDFMMREFFPDVTPAQR